MNYRGLATLFLGLGLSVSCSKAVVVAVNAPPSIADTMWVYSGQGGSNATRGLTWYRADGTYQTFFGKSVVEGEVTYQDPDSGTYAYAASGTTATLQVNGGTSYSPGNLVFSSSSVASNPTNIPIAPLSFWTIYHHVSVTGAANLSVNVNVSPGHSATTGFVVPGTAQLALLRVIGPSLAAFGDANGLTSPIVSLFHGSQQVSFDINSDLSGPWNPAGIRIDSGSNISGFQAIFSLVGAFPLVPGAGDWAEVVVLQPGTYTLAAQAPAGAQGDTLCEVYFLDYAQ